MTPVTGMRTHMCGELRPEHVGRRVSLCGWVARRREHGEHLAFVDLRDHTGIVQCVVDGTVDVRSEWVLRVDGHGAARRPEGTVNAELRHRRDRAGRVRGRGAGRGRAAAVPRRRPGRDRRVGAPALPLRRPAPAPHAAQPAAAGRVHRRHARRDGAPGLLRGRDAAAVDAHARGGAGVRRARRGCTTGSFYVLPQSPQIAKQLLMVAGMDRYFQMARCLRDEDLRADRQFEFTQLDIEASFVTERDVQAAVTEAVVDATEAAVGEAPSGIERMTWHEAMDRFGVDKPDLRFGMELVDLSDRSSPAPRCAPSPPRA